MLFQGEEYLINSTTAGNQEHPTQTVLGNGDILVAWQSQENSDHPNEVRAQILNPDGNVSSPDFLVNTTAESQNAVTATTLTNGDALVVWSSTNLTTEENDVFARVVDAEGHLGPEFVVNSSVINSEQAQSGVSVASLADGDVMLVSSTVNAEGGREIAGHLLGADGSPVGSGFIIDAAFADDQLSPAVTAMADGRAFVTWVVQNHGSGTMYGQIVNPDGSADTAYFPISPPAGGFSADPTALSNDNVLVTWDQNDGIHGQIVGSDGAAVGSNFLISGEGALESVTSLADGRAVAVWWEASDGLHDDGIYARVINADGTMSTPEFIVNSANDRSEISPHVTELPNGEIFVTWSSTGANLDEDIHGRLLTLDHTVSGTPGNDALHGGAGSDEIYGAAGNDALTGGAGDDILSGGSGHNFLWGNEGNDTFLGGSGSDAFAGGAGKDTVSYELSHSGVKVDLAANTASGGDAAGDSFNSIENLTGSAHKDTLIGNADANHFIGGAGNDALTGNDGDDLLQGGSGNDRIWGNHGNDTLAGGSGADILSGGAGIDTADYAASPNAVTVNLVLGTGSGGDASGDKLSSIENVGPGGIGGDALPSCNCNDRGCNGRSRRC